MAKEWNNAGKRTKQDTEIIVFLISLFFLCPTCSLTTSTLSPNGSSTFSAVASSTIITATSSSEPSSVAPVFSATANNSFTTIQLTTTDMSTEKRPSGPTGVVVSGITESGFTVSWTDTHLDYSHVSIIIDTAPTQKVENQTKGNYTFAKNTSNAYVITGLNSGTFYNISVYTMQGGLLTDSPFNLSSFTRPSGPTKVVVSGIRESGFTVSWTDTHLNYSHVSILIDPAPTQDDKHQTKGNYTFAKNTSNTYVIIGLNSGTLYNISVYTMQGGLLTDSPFNLSSFTKPAGPGKVVINNISESGFTVSWSDTKSNYTHVSILINALTEIMDEKCEAGNCTFQRTPNNSYFLGELQSGTFYKIAVYTMIGGLLTDSPINSSTYTRPSGPTEVVVSGIKESGFTVSWTGTHLDYSNVSILIDPAPTQEAEHQTNGNYTFAKNTNNTYVITGLNSSTLYNISVYTMQGGLLTDSPFNLSSFTKPAGPGEVVINNISESGFTVSWSDTKSNYTHVSILINALTENMDEKCIAGNCIFQRTPNNSYFLGGLQSGTFYKIAVYTMIGGLLTDSPINSSTYTRPSGPTDVVVSSITESGFTVSWTDSNSDYSHVSILIDPAPTQHQTNGNYTFAKNTSNAYVIIGLNSGTLYNISVYTMQGGLLTDSPFNIPSLTKPAGPVNCHVSTITESGFTVSWIDTKSNYTHVSILLDPSTKNADKICSAGNCTFLKMPNNSYVVGGLQSGKFYNISVYTMIGGLLTDHPFNTSINTRPSGPTSVVISGVTESGLTVSWEDTHLDYSHVSVLIDPDPSYVFEHHIGRNYTFVRNTSNTYVITGLNPGTLYSISVYTIQGGLLTQTPSNISSYTKPERVQNVTVTQRTNTSLALTWNKPLKGKISNYTTEFVCQSPNKYSNKNTNYTIVKNDTVAAVSDLDPGTKCTVSITPRVGDKTGELFKINKTTYETAPGEVASFVNNATTARSISVIWQKPERPNGVIRQYRLRILDIYQNCTQEETVFRTNNSDEREENYFCMNEDADADGHGNCSNFFNATIKEYLEDAEILTHTANQLHPYRNYSVSVLAFTRCWGNPVKENITTKEDVPSKAPGNLKMSEVGPSSINLTWTRLNDLEDGNGLIKNYTIVNTYTESICSNPLDGVPKTQNLTSISDSISVTDLRPNWNYNFSIFGSNSAGEGPKSEIITIKTDQSYPGTINFSDIAHESLTDTNATIKWSPPCRTNGIITVYGLELNNTDNKTVIKENITANATKKVFEKLYPYSNYSFTIKAYTNVGAGNLTQPLEFRTHIGIPYQPTIVNAEPKTSSSLDVIWSPPYLYTGPTDYFVEAVDSANQSNNCNCSIKNDFNATKCLVEKLHPYWTYNVTVTAITEKGQKQSLQKMGTTAEDVPGPVSLKPLIAENDIFKPRLIEVLWDPLSRWDEHGILTSYNILAININNSFLRNVTVPRKPDGTMQHSFNLTTIPPGYYNITLSASTKVGKGPDRWQQVKLSSGVPLIKNETTSGFLITAGHKKVNNEKKQISVQIPIETLLCLSDNGEPRKWGVIVAEDGEAKDNSFRGRRTEFEANKFKNWFDIKDKDKIPPYKATPDDWAPVNCSLQTKGSRRKRSIEENFITFEIGVDNDCAGMPKDKYCNGELLPGKGYRVKIYMCTDDACIETQYSKAIFTDPDLTVPIVASVLSILVVIAVVAVVVFSARRRKLCFANDVGGTSSDDEDKEMQMDKIERPNAFKPGPVKLSEFPAYVEKMHRDSDLLFADAYKLLRDNSPKHPMLAAEQQCSRPKNRYTDILPFDHSRVKILPTEDIEGSDYINANYIPGYVSPREYIAAQGPMTATFEDFWRMVWEQNVDTIVMLTKLVEKGRRKCDQYWPELSEPQFYGDLVVNLQSESNMSDYVIRIFEVKLKDMKKTVRHFSYLKWPDMGCPETPELLLEFVKAVRQYTNREHASKAHGPMVVHCSAGVGRTGTFIAVDILLQHVVDHDEVDIYKLVLNLRNHRLRMIQTEDQYVYVHECIKAFITTDENEEDEHLYENYPGAKPEEEENAYENTAFSKAPEK